MKISGRTIAYLIILLVVFIAGGITFAGAQGFPPNPLPVPVEENGIVEVESLTLRGLYRGADCPIISEFRYKVPDGKRLVIEHATASAVNNNFRRYREPAAINIFTEVDGYRHMSHLLVFSENGFPVAGGGPITYYLDPGDGVGFRVDCPSRTGVDDIIEVNAAVTGRLVPYPHPSMIPTATPAP